MAKPVPDHILDVAEPLFMAKGYRNVTLREIGEQLAMKHASLYYYLPGGKQQLYVEVLERNFQRHNDGLQAAIRQAGPQLQQQLYAAADWFWSQPPMEFSQLAQSGIDAAEITRLQGVMYDQLRGPIVAALAQAAAHDGLHLPDVNMGVMAFIALVQTSHTIPDAPRSEVRRVNHAMVDMLLHGWLPR